MLAEYKDTFGKNDRIVLVHIQGEWFWKNATTGQIICSAEDLFTQPSARVARNCN